jgi:hypothetical protein
VARFVVVGEGATPGNARVRSPGSPRRRIVELTAGQIARRGDEGRKTEMSIRSRIIRGSIAAPLTALAAAGDVHAGVDLAALAVSTSDAYGLFSIAIAVVIVLLLWYAVDDGAADERALKSGRKQTGRAGFDRDRRDSDGHAA